MIPGWGLVIYTTVDKVKQTPNRDIQQAVYGDNHNKTTCMYNAAPKCSIRFLFYRGQLLTDFYPYPSGLLRCTRATLHCNVLSRWLRTYTKLSLQCTTLCMQYMGQIIGCKRNIRCIYWNMHIAVLQFLTAFYDGFRGIHMFYLPIFFSIASHYDFPGIVEIIP